MTRQARRTARRAVATPQSRSVRHLCAGRSTADGGGCVRACATVEVRTAIASSETALAYGNRGAAASPRRPRRGARLVARAHVPRAPRHRLLAVLACADERRT